MYRLKHFQIKVAGIVQGVWFRKYTQEAALQFGVKGFVMNLPDNSVYIEAVGDDEQLKKFIAWCYVGSPKSKVEKVEVLEKTSSEKLDGFEIRS